MSRHPQTPLFLLAFVIALVIKLAVHETERPSERVIDAQITYNPPSSDVILYDRVEKVRVGVRGQSNEIIQLSPFTVEVVVDVPPGRRGTTDVTLGSSNVRFRALGDFEVISIEPNHFTIQVEPRAVATVPVEAELVGEPAAGARAEQVEVRPAWAEISGPESRVRGVSRLKAPVSLDGHARSYADNVAVVSPDPLIRVQPSRVVVEVTMQEPELSISVENLREEDDAS